jgi:phosphatidylglycerol:prolipoprotein diacylglycerol transferase
VLFHVGPLQIHTYGIGLAITFWFAYRYLARRLVARGYPDDWLGATFVWIVIAAIVGARLVHVVANLGYYTSNPGDVFAIWHGGLSSFGGLAFGIPVGLISAHRRCPQLRATVALDLVTPVLVAAWAIGRLLGPQLMVAGGGKPTSQWFGMYYAGEVGRRIPVPLIQAVECGVIFLILLFIEWRAGPVLAVGVIASLGAGLWGLSRFFDEYLWLTHDNGTDAVEIASIAMFVLGGGFALWRWRRVPPLPPNSPMPNPGLASGNTPPLHESAQ